MRLKADPVYSFTVNESMLLISPRFMVWDNEIRGIDPETQEERTLNGDAHIDWWNKDSYAHLWSQRISTEGGKGAAQTMIHEALHALSAEQNLSLTESEVRILTNYCVLNEPRW